ncbi:MAG: hypothetical protein AVDCRST_MAG02-4327, partial [uncultured Rubrobacteraceae bacterium]
DRARTTRGNRRDQGQRQGRSGRGFQGPQKGRYPGRRGGRRGLGRRGRQRQRDRRPAEDSGRL